MKTGYSSKTLGITVELKKVWQKVLDSNTTNAGFNSIINEIVFNPVFYCSFSKVPKRWVADIMQQTCILNDCNNLRYDFCSLNDVKF